MIQVSRRSEYIYGRTRASAFFSLSLPLYARTSRHGRVSPVDVRERVQQRPERDLSRPLSLFGGGTRTFRRPFLARLKNTTVATPKGYAQEGAHRLPRPRDLRLREGKKRPSLGTDSFCATLLSASDSFSKLVQSCEHSFKARERPLCSRAHTSGRERRAHKTKRNLLISAKKRNCIAPPPWRG